MSDEIVFYTHYWSRGRVARWMLEEVGAPYRTVLLDYGTTMKEPDYLAINPMGKVPALTHRGVTVTETAAICAYLADAFPQAGLAPERDDPARGAYYRWMFFSAGPVELAVTLHNLGVTVAQDKRTMVGTGSSGDVADILAALLKDREFILGDRFSAVDVYLGSQISWGTRFQTLPAREAFVPYLERIMSRPAALRALAIDEELAAQASARAGG